MSAIGAAFDMAGGLFSTFYNMSRNSEIDRRDDTAIQRRVRDLEKAGLNPLLAAGQGAGTSTGMSANLDTRGTAQTFYDLKMSRETYKQQQLQTRLLEDAVSRSALDNYVYNQQLAATTGIFVDDFVGNRSNVFKYGPFGHMMKTPKSYTSQVFDKNGNPVGSPQRFTNFAFPFGKIQLDKEIFDKWRGTMSSETDYDYNQSLFNLKTQGYLNGLSIAQDTIAPILDLAGLLNPISVARRAFGGNKNYNYSNINGNWNSQSVNHNYIYRQRH